jgi:hypothetical protein
MQAKASTGGAPITASVDCHIVDAFVNPSKLGSGNPAAVVVLNGFKDVVKSTPEFVSRPELAEAMANAGSTQFILGISLVASHAPGANACRFSQYCANDGNISFQPCRWNIGHRPELGDLLNYPQPPCRIPTDSACIAFETLMRD